MSAPSIAVDFVRSLDRAALPPPVLAAARRHLLDLLGVAAAGARTELGGIVAEHAVAEFGAGRDRRTVGPPGARLLFDGRRASASGAALAGGMRIDSIDAHDGHRLTKGHVGCGVLPAVLAAAELRRGGDGAPASEEELLVALVVGYEIGTRAGIALHRTAADYHTSGAWVAIAAAAVVARLLGLDAAATREAFGIAEYHGPRSPMMRVIDHPSMLKDGSGWGAMAGVSAALLARRGFSGSPAATVEGMDVSDLWADLGTRWYTSEQYIKLYPVCRWAQPAIAAALALKGAHGVDVEDVESVSIGTFAASARLDARAPATTEQAQYSLPFPVACALVHGRVGVAEIDGRGLADERVLALSRAIEVREVATYTAAFPAERRSDVTIVRRDGRTLESGPTLAAGDPEAPLDEATLEAKFRALATPALGVSRAASLLAAARRFGDAPSLSSFETLVYAGTDGAEAACGAVSSR